MNQVPKTDDTEAVLDLASLQEIRAIARGHELLGKWVRLFLSEAPQKLAELESALEGRDMAAVTQLAHSLKSNSGWLGGRRLATACERLEQAAQVGSATECQRLLPALQRELQPLHQALQRFLESNS